MIKRQSLCSCCGKEVEMYNTTTKIVLSSGEEYRIHSDLFLCDDCLQSKKYDIENEHIKVETKKRHW